MVCSQLHLSSPSTPISKENSLSTEQLHHTIENPVLAQTPIIPKPSQSTGGKVRNRLSLSKNIRDKITKKRLNFVAPSSTSNCSEITETKNTNDVTSIKSNLGTTSESEHSDETKNNAMNMEIPDELLTEWPDDEIDIQPTINEHNFSHHELLSIEDQCIEIEKKLETKRRQISQYHKHQVEVEKLQSAILTWENGCRNALSELQKRIQPPQDVATIFQHFNITMDLD